MAHLVLSTEMLDLNNSVKSAKLVWFKGMVSEPAGQVAQDREDVGPIQL